MKKTKSSWGFFVFTSAIAFIAIQGGRADDVFHSNFNDSTLETQGWASKEGRWQVGGYNANGQMKNDPGTVAKFGKTPDGWKGPDLLIKKFPPVVKPYSLTLTFDAGWGWGNTDQGADSLGIMLVDDSGNGYVFEVHRTKAAWAAQWGLVANWVPGKMNWASGEIDATQVSVVSGGGLQTFTIKRTGHGSWQFSGANWKGAVPLAFDDTTTSTFSMVALVGDPNFDDDLFNKIKLEVTSDQP